MSIRIAIVDDHEMLRQGIESLLPKEYEIVLSTGDLNELLGFKDAIDVVILDLNLADLPGASIIEKVLQFIPGTKIVVYSMRDSIESIAACYDAHANAFVSKGSPIDSLLKALEKLSSDDLYFEPGIAEKLTKYQLKDDSRNPKKALSEKDLEIFKLRAQGVNVPEIAEQLDASQKNIYNRITIIQRKLNIDKEEFETYAKRYGIIYDEEKP